MKKCLLISLALLSAIMVQARDLWKDGTLQDKTLRLDYIFSGTDKISHVALDRMISLEGWSGRRVNLKNIPVAGNGRLLMTDAATGDTLYRNSFSTLFQEWQTTEEATLVERSFENVFLVPMPSEPARISLELSGLGGKLVAEHSFVVNPSDILIRPLKAQTPPYKTILKSGDSKDCIDVVILAEGYREDEMEEFYKHANTALEALLRHEPFGKLRGKFNFHAVAVPSRDSGVSIPGKGEWKQTAVHSHFNTFYSDRYLTTLRLKDLHDLLAGIPYEHIIILANTDNYGGGGIYNSYTLTTARHLSFEPVVVHEFGHSFAALADEYYYDDQYVQYYVPGIEPWEQNITTKADFASKWEDMMGQEGVGLYEGAGYRSKGAWRSAEDCRMKTNSSKGFCKVCQRAIERIILFNTEQF